MGFGIYARQIRERRREANKRYSIRQTAQRVGIQPAYLSKVERGDASPPSETMIRRLALDLEEDPDFLLALAGKIAGDVREVIIQRPILFAELIRSLNHTPDDELANLVCKVRNDEILRKRLTLFS